MLHSLVQMPMLSKSGIILERYIIFTAILFVKSLKE